MKAKKLLVVSVGLLSLLFSAYVRSAEESDETEQQIEATIDECENKASKKQVVACLTWILARYKPFFGSGHSMMMDQIKRRIWELTSEPRE